MNTTTHIHVSMIDMGDAYTCRECGKDLFDDCHTRIPTVSIECPYCGYKLAKEVGDEIECLNCAYAAKNGSL